MNAAQVKQRCLPSGKGRGKGCQFAELICVVNKLLSLCFLSISVVKKNTQSQSFQQHIPDQAVQKCQNIHDKKGSIPTSFEI